jgi:hypothetical protein
MMMLRRKLMVVDKNTIEITIDGPCYWYGVKKRDKHELYIHSVNSSMECHQCGIKFNKDGEITYFPNEAQVDYVFSYIPKRELIMPTKDKNLYTCDKNTIEITVDGPCYWRGKKMRDVHELYIVDAHRGSMECKQCGINFNKGGEITYFPDEAKVDWVSKEGLVMDTENKNLYTCIEYAVGEEATHVIVTETFAEVVGFYKKIPDIYDASVFLHLHTADGHEVAIAVNKISCFRTIESSKKF